MTAPTVRCAIYTRKSSDEGLSQSFNSLHAQREACEAYVRSQVGEGWHVSAARYDDGGYSGAGMNRPALRQLLLDVTTKKIDVVLVYKVDRLTRSLADFARMVEAFEQHEVAFVSVTQAFNTTGSMGRLMLNVLLSFAQFEREVTGERIRDKIAASKAKGMWMGGTVPLGYDPPEGASRALKVNEAEAPLVREIFEKFLQAGGLLELQRQLAEEGIRSKRRVSTQGRLIGGYNFSRGALRHLLQNKIYIGVIAHKGVCHSGLHQPIVERQTFDAVQAVLIANSRKRRDHVGMAKRALLYGMLFDGDGQPMAPSFGHAHGRVYAYYVSAAVPMGLSDSEDDTIRRTSASAIDDLARMWVSQLLQVHPDDASRLDIRRLVSRLEIHSSSVQIVVRARALPGAPPMKRALAHVRSQLSPSEQVRADPLHAGALRIILPIRLVMRGGRTWVVGPKSGAAVVRSPNKRLVRHLRRAHAILRECEIAPGSIQPYRKARAPRSTGDRRMVELAFLAPEVQAAILSGAIQHIEPSKVPLSWAEQRRLLFR